MHIYFILIKYFLKRTLQNDNNIKHTKRQHKTMLLSANNTVSEPFHSPVPYTKQKKKHRIS